MKRLLLLSIVVVIAFSLVIVGCNPEPTTTTAPPATTTAAPTSAEPTATETVPTGTITDVAATWGYDTFDPSLVSSWSGLIYQFVVRNSEDNNFEGDVLESWDISEDGCTWTFHVKPDNYFTNGDPVTAEDVMFSLSRFSESARSPWAPYLRDTYNFVGMTVIDDLTLEYETAHPESTLLPCFSATAILDKAEYDRVGEEAYFLNPVGSGPWKLVEYITGTSVEFEANTDYCYPDEIPEFQYYLQLLVPELATRISMFKTGQCDLLSLDDYARMKELQDEGYPAVEYGIAGTDSFAYQKSWMEEAGPVNDINIRKAMSYALNRQEVCDTWYSGYAIPGGQFFMVHGIFGWSDALEADPYDPTYAEQLIADAGYPDAFDDPTITIYCQATDQDRLLYYMSYWQAVGLQVELKVMETATYWSYLGFGPPPDDNIGWIWFWKSFSYPNSVYHSANMYTSSGVHKVTNDATADYLYSKITNQVSYEEAWAAMEEFQVYVKGLYTNIGVVEYANYFLYNPDVFAGFEGRNWQSYVAAVQGAIHAQ